MRIIWENRKFSGANALHASKNHPLFFKAMYRWKWLLPCSTLNFKRLKTRWNPWRNDKKTNIVYILWVMLTNKQTVVFLQVWMGMLKLMRETFSSATFSYRNVSENIINKYIFNIICCVICGNLFFFQVAPNFNRHCAQ